MQRFESGAAMEVVNVVQNPPAVVVRPNLAEPERTFKMPLAEFAERHPQELIQFYVSRTKFTKRKK